MEPLRATLPLTVRAVDEEARTIDFVGSTDHVDRAGDIVRQNFDLTNFKKNRLFLWGHDYSQLPLGKAIKIWREKDPNAKGKNNDPGSYRTLFRIQFVPEELYPFAEQVRQFYAKGFLSAVSIGFIPKERRRPTDEERELYGIESPWSEIFEKSELLELSAVTVPMNANALAEKGLNPNLNDKGVPTPGKCKDTEAVLRAIEEMEEDQDPEQAALEEEIEELLGHDDPGDLDEPTEDPEDPDTEPKGQLLEAVPTIANVHVTVDLGDLPQQLTLLGERLEQVRSFLQELNANSVTVADRDGDGNEDLDNLVQGLDSLDHFYERLLGSSQGQGDR